jgi:hypothetical protein
MVELYFHSPIRLHGVMLNYLRTGTTLPCLPLLFVCQVLMQSSISELYPCSVEHSIGSSLLDQVLVIASIFVSAEN